MVHDWARNTAPRPRMRFPIMHAAAYVAVAGVAAAEALNMPPGVRLVASGGLLALFAAALVFTFRQQQRFGRTGFVVLAAAETLLAIGVAALGASPLYGAILMLVVCTVVGISLPVVASVAWTAICVLALLGCLRLQGDSEWISNTLTFGAGFFAFVAFSIALRRSQQARAESQQLLAELQGAQGRLREMAVMEERQRLAREMHDSVGHRLTAAAVLLEGAARLIPSDPGRAARMLDSSREQVREGLAELRAAVTALHAEDASERGLEETLRALADLFSQASGAELDLVVQPDIPAPDPERSSVLVRTAQEALTNVLKHAAAGRVRLELRSEPAGYVLTCSDDGRGPASRAGEAAGGGAGFGLRNLQERAARFGGRVEVIPGREAGTVLSLTLPAGGAHG